MQKKLMAVAVAGALAMPGIAAAQSVSVEGVFKMGIDNVKISGESAARAGLHNSETRVSDNSSQIHFLVNEDLGGGLAAVAKVDMRFSPDNGALSASGNDWVGLKSPGMGMLTIGRWDLHYGRSPSDIAGKGSLKSAAISIMDYIGNSAIANTTRTPNVIKWDSPNFSGFAVTAAYSTSPFGADADMTTGVRKGSATNIDPSFTGRNFKVEWSNWNAKADGTVLDQKGNTVQAYYFGGGLKIGGAWNKSSIETTSKRERVAYMVGGSFSTGPHEIHAHYDIAKKTKTDGTENDDTGAKMIAVAYVYNLSKRTAMSVTYAKITNDANINYRFFTDTGGANTAASPVGDQSSGLAAPFNGEDPQIISVILRHAF